MFSKASVGSPRAITGAASDRWRVRLVASSTSKTASGRGIPSIVPFNTLTATRSSSEYGLRLYTPGRSTIVIS